MHKAVHLCVLNNSQEVVPYIEAHKEELKCFDQRLRINSKLLEKVHLEKIVEWLQAKIKPQAGSTYLKSDETLSYLVKGPRRCAMSHSGFIINGKRFHTMKSNISTQDYGVHIEADTLTNYYGIIRQILVLDFYKFRLAVFLCDWANMASGVKKVDGFTLVNLHEGRKRGRMEGPVSEEPDALFESDAPVSQTREEEELTPDDANTTKKNEKSEKMKIIRGKQLHPHILSQKGYARYEYDWNINNPGKRLCMIELFIHCHEQKNKIKNAELQKKLDEQPPNEGPIPIKFDVLSQVLGKEKSGGIRGMGAGVTPSRSQSGTGGGDPNSGDGGSKRTSTPTDTSQDVPENDEVGIHFDPQTGTSKYKEAPFCVNDLCEVLDWEGTGLVVARGKISPVDPTTKVHGYNLGPDCYIVAVEETVVPRAEFYRPQPEFSAMEDAVRSTIAWPTKYIVPL
ncbi:hypothetical protein ACLB2K_005867 [Fragaria x ananassa]